MTSAEFALACAAVHIVMLQLYAYWLWSKLMEMAKAVRQLIDLRRDSHDRTMRAFGHWERSIELYDAALDVIAELTGLSQPHELVRLRLAETDNAAATEGPERVQKCPITTCKGNQHDDG